MNIWLNNYWQTILKSGTQSFRSKSANSRYDSGVAGLKNANPFSLKETGFFIDHTMSEKVKNILDYKFMRITIFGVILFAILTFFY